jgi:NAD(P)-dependent dehydrogenase (short-subunit alcohol dehydrogenase family)
MRVLITGAGRGLGLELARQLLRGGHRVFAAVRDPGMAVDLAQLSQGERLVPTTLDVSDPDSIAAARRFVGCHTAALDLLINNAGTHSPRLPPAQANQRFGALEPAGLLQLVQVNAVGPLLVTQAFADLLEAGERPRVLCISSRLGSIGDKHEGGNYGYCASKATLNMLTRTMAWDLAPRGITAVAMNPGWVRTAMGGPNAPLSAAESVAGMLAVIEGLEPSDAGRFLRWDGGEQAW